MEQAAIIERLRQLAVVPVVRTPTEEAAYRVIHWLVNAGLGTVEITLTTPRALELIQRLRRETDLLIGAGTLRNAADARDAIDAGAQYLVSPAFVAGMAVIAAEAEVPCVMGALSPTEVLAAHAAGADAVKVFPVSAVGGAAYIKALRSVFPDIILAPTGGIAPQDVATFLNAGAAFVGVGGNLVDPRAIAEGRRDAIEAAARTALASAQSHQEKE